MPDTVATYFFLCASALLAGFVNAVAGGGTLLTFPALVAALGGSQNPLAGVLANGTSTVALMPGSLAGAWGYRAEIKAAGRFVLWMLVPSFVGGAVGTLLVTELDPKIFDGLIPWLILTATALFALQGPIKRWTGGHHDRPVGRRFAVLILAQFLIAVYGGYFGAGIGILMLSALPFMGIDDIHRVNGVKTVLASVINGVSVGIFVARDAVVWKYALAMAGAAVVGGYVGARTARRMPARYVRWAVVVIGFGLAAYYFWPRPAG